MFKEINLNTGIGIWSIAIGLFSMFIFCFIADFIVKYLTGIGDMVYLQSEWYRYPIQLQKHLTLIIGQSQLPFEFNGFKIIGCNLITFGNVSNIKLYVITLEQCRINT